MPETTGKLNELESEVNKLKVENAKLKDKIEPLTEFATKYGPMIDDIYKGVRVFTLIGKFITWCTVTIAAIIAIVKGVRW